MPISWRTGARPALGELREPSAGRASSPAPPRGPASRAQEKELVTFSGRTSLYSLPISGILTHNKAADIRTAYTISALTGRDSRLPPPGNLPPVQASCASAKMTSGQGASGAQLSERPFLQTR